MTRTISPDELKQLLERRDVLVIDVRRKADYDADTQAVPGAMWRNPEEMQRWSETLPRDKEIVVCCARGGSVSNATVDHLQAKGLKARFIEGGIEGWKKAGGETVSK